MRTSVPESSPTQKLVDGAKVSLNKPIFLVPWTVQASSFEVTRSPRLRSVGSRQATERARQIAETYPFAHLGAMIWLVDASLFVPGDMFRGAVDDMVRLAREQLIPLRGYAEATLPGAIEHRLEAEYRAEGIKMDRQEKKRLTEVGNDLGVEIPW